MENKANKYHVLALPFPSQGHINPMLQFSKLLASKGFKVTFATTIFSSKNMKTKFNGSIHLDTISDGYDDGGSDLNHAQGIAAYLDRLETEGSRTLAELITRHNNSPNPIDCIIYDAFCPWAWDVAQKFGLVGAMFSTQNCIVTYLYYCVHQRVLSFPICSKPDFIPGLHVLELQDIPSYLSMEMKDFYPSFTDLVLRQFSNTHKPDFILVNTSYELEDQAAESMSKECPMLTIGPTVVSNYMENGIKDEAEYGIHLYNLESSMSINWLKNKPAGSVVYVSFGSWINLSVEQMEELALGLKNSNFYFIWVVRPSEEAKLPQKFVEETIDKGLVVNWSPQFEIISNEAIGCFLTHCGWNSITEALSFEVAMVGMPQWSDQFTNAKLIEDLWKVGVRVKIGENGIVGREEIEFCIREVMKGEKRKEIKSNAKKWKEVVMKAISKDGSSDKNIHEFVSKLSKS